MIGLGELWADLADLALPARCAGCGQPGRLRYASCAGCASSVAGCRPFRTGPRPEPAGLPPLWALGPYDGVLRELLLAYKERGRYALAVPLGALLAEVALAASGGRPVLLVPVPSTARASRQRHGDHLARLARQAVRRLRAAGVPTHAVRALRAAPRPDSAGLSAAERAVVASSAFTLSVRVSALRQRLREGAAVILVDDVVTTGSTLVACAGVLASAGVPVDGSAVLAATQRRGPAQV